MVLITSTEKPTRVTVENASVPQGVFIMSLYSFTFPIFLGDSAIICHIKDTSH